MDAGLSLPLGENCDLFYFGERMINYDLRYDLIPRKITLRDAELPPLFGENCGLFYLGERMVNYDLQSRVVSIAGSLDETQIHGMDTRKCIYIKHTSV